MRLSLASIAALCFSLSLAACGGDDDGGDDDPADDAGADSDGGGDEDAAGAADAAPLEGNFDCLGAALPTTADDPVVISGIIFRLQGFMTGTTVGAAINAFLDDGSMTSVGTESLSDEAGFSLSLETGTEPLDVYIRGTLTEYRPGLFFPPFPTTSDTTGILPLWDDAAVGLLANAGEADQDAGMGMLVVGVLDCNADEIANVSISATDEEGQPVGQLRYSGPESAFRLPDKSLTATTETGVAIFFNVPPGRVTLNASGGGTTFRENDVLAVADEITGTAMVP